MKAQVLVDDNYLKSLGIYRYSIVNIVKTHKIRGFVVWHRASYKGGDLLYFREHELKIL